ncbi:MAG: ERF family protein [Methanobacterium sp. ERen5]|nr:MAG: ERF family protein [Methanobacterium sp. ERen5]
MSYSPQIAEAFIKAQGELKNPPKSSYNPFNNSKYTELSDILTYVRPILIKHGLGITQLIGSTHEGKPTVKTILIHESGETIETPTECLDPDSNKKMNGLQEMGSAVSYGKRYQLCALLGIAPEEDTDGVTNEDLKQSNQSNSSNKPGNSKTNNKPDNKPGNKPSSKPNNKPSNKPSNKPANKPKVTESELEDGTKIEEAKGSKPGGKPVAEKVEDPVDENKLLAILQKEQSKLYIPLKKKFKTIKNRDAIKESHIQQACQELLGEGIYTPDDVGIVKETLDI